MRHCWLGPWDQRHDFRAGNLALEVKSSNRSDSTTVQIHGPDQLLPPNSGKLVLVLVRMEPVEDGSVAVGGLFDKLISIGAARQRLREGLAELGCMDPYNKEWNRHRFKFHSMSAWRVSHGFPRLTPREIKGDEIPLGVKQLSYAIDTTHAENFRMTPADFKEYLKGMVK